MYLTQSLIEESLKNLESVHPFYGITFLAFKAAKLPVEQTMKFPPEEEQKFLEQFYKPDKNTELYYRVFKFSNKNKHWITSQYLLLSWKIARRKDFEKALIHTKNTNYWGWQPNYIQILKDNLQDHQPVSAFYLAVWLYRERNWPPHTTAANIINTFFDEFNITEEEKQKLFDISVPQTLDPSSLFQNEKVLWEDLRISLGIPLPPDAPPVKGGTLALLKLKNVGPVKDLCFTPAERVNLITGDNGLGKTFLLECAWWALSGNWTRSPAYPRQDVSKNGPRMTFQISGEQRISKEISSSYDWRTQHWVVPKKRPTMPGLLIYARVDGAFAVWDPARIEAESKISHALVFTREDVWDGLRVEVNGSISKIRALCNGLIYDWVHWQDTPETKTFETLKKVLRRLSPPNLERSDVGPLEPGKPARIPGDTRPIPTIKHPYGEVPLVHASAGVRRIVALAYLIVWAWEEHKAQSQLIREAPQKRMVILIDEIEAHLHPQWQRLILPALLDIQKDLEAELQVQFLVATHSPLVMASMEPRFDANKDKIFHLNLTKRGLFDGEVILEEKDFVRYGTSDSWLMSEVFEMRHARSIEAEQVIEDAKRLQLQAEVSKAEVEEVSRRLVKYLAGDDKFWPRWTFFAEQHGVKL